MLEIMRAVRICIERARLVEFRELCHASDYSMCRGDFRAHSVSGLIPKFQRSFTEILIPERYPRACVLVK